MKTSILQHRGMFWNALNITRIYRSHKTINIDVLESTSYQCFFCDTEEAAEQELRQLIMKWELALQGVNTDLSSVTQI